MSTVVILNEGKTSVVLQGGITAVVLSAASRPSESSGIGAMAIGSTFEVA